METCDSLMMHDPTYTEDALKFIIHVVFNFCQVRCDA